MRVSFVKCKIDLCFMFGTIQNYGICGDIFENSFFRETCLFHMKYRDKPQELSANEGY